MSSFKVDIRSIVEMKRKICICFFSQIEYSKNNDFSKKVVIIIVDMYLFVGLNIKEVIPIMIEGD